MSLHAEIATDFTSLLEEAGADITWKGRTYRALIGDPNVQVDLQSGGFLPQGNFTVKLLRSQLETMPEHGEVITLDGKPYAITAISHKPGHPIITLTIAA